MRPSASSRFRVVTTELRMQAGSTAEARGQVIDELDALGRLRAGLAGEQIADDQIDGPGKLADQRFERRARGPRDTDQIREALLEQCPQYARADEAVRAGDQYPRVVVCQPLLRLPARIPCS